MDAKYQKIESPDEYELGEQSPSTNEDIIETIESEPPAYSNETNDCVVRIGDATSLSEKDIFARLPSKGAPNSEVRAFIQLLLDHRGEAEAVAYDASAASPAPSGNDIRYLVGSDLFALKEEELHDAFPEAWPAQLRTLLAKDVKKYTDWVRQKEFR